MLRLAAKTRVLSFPRSITRFCLTYSTNSVISDRPLEEERLPGYHPEQFCPVRIGEVFHSRYKVLGKLGYGAHSTSWLCRDNKETKYVAIKVCTRNTGPRPHRELDFYKYIGSVDSDHPGQAFIRNLYGTFDVTGPSGSHACFVHPPMHMTVRELQYKNASRRLNMQLLRWTLRNLLMALAFLHGEGDVVHADINPSNIMFSISDQTILEEFECAEAESPSPTKVIDGTRAIYGTRKFGMPRDTLWGQPVLCDFGEARIGKTHRGLIQPDLYRAPEVLFDMEWGASADIWSVGTLIWDHFENRHLFSARDDEGMVSATDHVAEMVAYMGLPPLEYIRRSEVTQNVFDEQGAWRGAGGTQIPHLSFEKSVTVLDGEDKEKFLGFVRSMLQWLPERRKTAAELLEDPWMVGAV